MSSDRSTTQTAGTGAGTFSVADLKRRHSLGTGLRPGFQRHLESEGEIVVGAGWNSAQRADDHR